MNKSMCEGGCKHSEIMVGVPYRIAIGCLMYVMFDARPDLTAAVRVLRLFAADPCRTHWQALKKNFRYIQGTRIHGIEFQAPSHNGLQIFSNVE